MKPPDPSSVNSGKPRGRPRVDEARATVSTWLPAGTHDRLIELAKRHDQSVSATVRRLLTLRLK